MTKRPVRIVPSSTLFAPVSPPMRNGSRWIDYTNVRPTAREARAGCSKNWTGGWADLRMRGWTIEKVIVSPAHPQEDQL